MIESKKDYLDYIAADKSANGIKKGLGLLLNFNWQLLKSIRKIEYLNNCKSSEHMLLRGVRLRLAMHKYSLLSVLTGITIPPNTFGKGLYLPHYGYIVVNDTARFGDYCILQCGVNISENVVGGNSIYLGTGSKIMIGVKLADNIIIGANAVVTKDFTEPNIVVGGIPARKISNKGMLSGRHKI